MKIAILILVGVFSFSMPLFAQSSNKECTADNNYCGRSSDKELAKERDNAVRDKAFSEHDRCYDCYFDGKNITCTERPCGDVQKNEAKNAEYAASDHSRDSAPSSAGSNKSNEGAQTVEQPTRDVPANLLSLARLPCEEEEYYDECNAAEDDADSAAVCVLSKTIGRFFPRTSAEFKVEFKAYGRLSLSEFKAKYGKEHIAPDVDFKLTKLAFFKTKLLLRRLPDLIYINSAYRSKDHPRERKKTRPGTGPHCTMRAIDLRPGGFTNRARADWRAPMLNFPNYNREKTQIIVNAILKIDPKATILFNDPAIKGVKPYPGHDDHIHVTWSKDGVPGYDVKDE